MEKYISQKMEKLIDGLSFTGDLEISLKPLNGGCTVRVGCIEVAFSTIKEGIDTMNEYLNNPGACMTRWCKKNPTTRPTATGIMGGTVGGDQYQSQFIPPGLGPMPPSPMPEAPAEDGARVFVGNDQQPEETE